ncbi:thioester reductase domain-containing protein [Streptomyces sp. TRM 70351]|uniref:thioester reductase domain-containing protein n=1 Tax=Streptomyces sp. TRM 70351 TaxID=3116552 RepID=UPI002E7B3892|nr:thioester reductase domain-containing protein [Streptomyces sp. TRM 70351]MEE1930819.1 thioester reductase domain-containing protein [Streptomyces sp. TRM 70351]
MVKLPKVDMNDASIHERSLSLAEQDGILDEHIRPAISTQAVRYRTVVLTGATGHLGGYLCASILARTTWRVICVVRAEDEHTAVRRVRDTTLNAHPGSQAALDRVTAVPGDLSARDWGLGAEVFQQLAHHTDAVFHCAATVSMRRSYEQLRAANVHGTAEAIRLAATGRPKPLHYVSTLGVFIASRRYGAQVVCEDDEPHIREAGRRGYARSKAVAEALVRQARQRGLPVSIHRFPLLLGDSRTGACNPTDYLATLMSACVRIGMVPQGAVRFPATAVDHLAHVIVETARHEPPMTATLHVLYTKWLTLSDISAELNAAGYLLQPVPPQHWNSSMATAFSHAPQISAVLNALNPHVLRPSAPEALPAISSARTERLVRGMGLAHPPLDREFVARVVHHLMATGVLPPPGTVAQPAVQ